MLRGLRRYQQFKDNNSAVWDTWKKNFNLWELISDERQFFPTVFKLRELNYSKVEKYTKIINCPLTESGVWGLYTDNIRMHWKMVSSKIYGAQFSIR